MLLSCVLVDLAPWAGLLFDDRLERRRCGLCHRSVWWPLHATPERTPICMGPWGDQDSCFARAFVGTN